jgi:hypothetical protein
VTALAALGFALGAVIVALVVYSLARIAAEPELN